MSRPIRTTPASILSRVVVGFGVVGFDVGVVVGGFDVGVGGLIVGVGGVVGGGVVVGVVGGLPLVIDVIRRRLRGQRAAARVSAVSAPRSLWLVRGLLPGNEGAAWWAEVNSCLAEAVDPGERCRYVRSYRREVPQLIWTSWAEYLSASDRRELS